MKGLQQKIDSNKEQKQRKYLKELDILKVQKFSNQQQKTQIQTSYQRVSRLIQSSMSNSGKYYQLVKQSVNNIPNYPNIIFENQVQNKQLSNIDVLKKYLCQLHLFQQNLKQKQQLKDIIKLYQKQKSPVQQLVSDYNYHSKQQNKKFHSDLLNLIQIYQIKQREQILKKALTNGTFKKCRNFSTQIIISKYNQSKNSQIITLQIQLLNLSTTIKILNQKFCSYFHQPSLMIGSGSQGNVYEAYFQEQSYAIKCIPFRFDLNCLDYQFIHKRKIFQKILKQYFLLLLFSQLQIGPKVKNIMGFDLVIYKDCIQFSTQLCKSSNEINLQKSLQQKYEQDLKKILRIMHILKIVHRDIKPQNIMFSQSYKKFIFIDFGLSKVLYQQIGMKSMGRFTGTINYCSPQMLKLHAHSCQGYVDLYQNDLFGLKSSKKGNFYLMDMENQILNNFQIESQIQQQILYKILLNRVKFYSHAQNNKKSIFYYKKLISRFMDKIQQIKNELQPFVGSIKNQNQQLKSCSLRQLKQGPQNKIQILDKLLYFNYQKIQTAQTNIFNQMSEYNIQSIV